MIIISQNSMKKWLKYFDESYWKIKEYKFYKNSIEEEKYLIRQEMLENTDKELEKEEFCEVLDKEITKVDLSKH